ncbi:hypothetical protein DICVIV_09037 [Dictyocaulus viviparus]|uniref:Uncharacterized protein n=1 Tax=Dictyocaulus viviparus TaxID=29172 RepID=A0A0D8XM95_DICVI|nr:hypothetical protein DICVIV_09037 [Dictyocaulus viviparus]
MTANAVDALLRLLCYTSEHQTNAYKALAEVSSALLRILLEVWLPDGGAMPKVKCNDVEVDLLTSKLRAFMLEFNHEKIVETAMRDLDAKLALKVACELSAIKPEHASRLLEIACGTSLPSKNDVMELDGTARIMLNIHNINGVKHAQQILSLLDEIQRYDEGKMETITFHTLSIKSADIIERTPTKPMSRSEMVQHLKMATVCVTLVRNL